MLISNNSNNTAFGATIAPTLKIQLAKQVRISESKKRIGQQLSQKLLNMETWGSPKSEIVIAKNRLGHYCLGLRFKVSDRGPVLAMPIDNLRGRTELSQFLNLSKENIDSTENSIKYMYSKYGVDVFEKFAK